MNCKELTTFLQKVLDQRELIENPVENFERTERFIAEIESVYEKFETYHYGLRIRLSKEHNLSYVGEFHDGWATACPDINDHTSHYYFMNMQGELLRGEDGAILDFPLADRFSEGIAAVYTKEGDQRFIRTDGTFLSGVYKRTPVSADLKKRRFVSGRALVQADNGKEVYINVECVSIHGDLEVPITPFSDDGYAMVSAVTKYGRTTTEFMSTEGWGDFLNIEDRSYVPLANFSEGYGIVGKTEDGGQNYNIRLIDTNGRFVRDAEGKILSRCIDMRDSEIYPFHNGYVAFVVNNNTFFFIDKTMNYSFKDETGESVFYRVVGGSQHSFEDGLMPVRIKNDDGTETVRVLMSNGKYLRYFEGDKKGEIIELDRNAGGFNEDGLARTYVDGFVLSQWIDRKGRVVPFGNGEHK